MENLPEWWPDNIVLPDWARDALIYFADIWDQGPFGVEGGITYGQMFTALGVMILAVIIRGLFARTVVRAITRAAAGTETNLDDALVKSIAAPLKMVPIIIGVYVSMELMNLEGEARRIGDLIMQSLVTLSVFWTLNRAVGAFSFLLGRYESSLGWLIKTLQVLLLAMGAAAVLQIFGIPILPVIGGLGVFGVAVAFGAQDLVKNLISGIFLLVEKRFEPGEWIKVDGVVEGTVEQVGFRSTIVRQFDKAPVYVPNAIFNDREVVNFSRMTHRRIKWAIGVEYRTTKEQLAYIRDEIEAYLWNSDEFAKPPEAGLMVYVDNFNASSIDLLIYCFTKTKVWSDYLEVKERFMYKVMEIVHAAGTDFAFPSRTLYMQQQDAPEIIAPPARSAAVAEAQQRMQKRTEEQLDVKRGDEGEG